MTTKKHFEFTAEIIKAIMNEEDAFRAARKAIELFSKENPRFDKLRFLAACNINCRLA